MPALKRIMQPSNLTPIKIRGKGPRKKTWQPPAPKPSKSPPAKTGTQKRSRSSTEEPDVSFSSSDKRRNRRREKLALKKVSGAPIERLPKEILEMILLWSNNLNFAKASAKIGCVLSGQSTFTRVVLGAFAPTWDVWFGVMLRDVHGYWGWLEDEERIGGDPGFQSEVLECPWMSVDLILNAQRFWFRQDLKERRKRGEGYLHYGVLEACWPGTSGFDVVEDDIQKCFECEWDRYLEMADKILSSEAQSLQPRYEETPCSIAESSISIEFSSSAYFRDFVDNCSSNSRFRGLMPEWMDCTEWLSLDMHIKTRVPDNLIKDPLDDSGRKLKLLCLIVRQRAHLPGNQTWELGRLGYEKIMEHDDQRLSLVALVLFNRLGVFQKWPMHILGDKRQEAHDMCRAAKAANKDSSRWALADFLLGHTCLRADLEMAWRYS